MILSHKIRLYPNNQAVSYFKQACGTARFAYNWALDKWKSIYESGEKPSAYGLVKNFNSIKGDQFPWTSLITKWAPQKAIQDLGDAFKKFFKKETKYPRFKKRGVSKDSFYLGIGHFSIEGKKIRIPKLGWVKLAQEIRFPGKHKSVVISREADKWYASVSIEIDEGQWVYPHSCENQAVVGIDLGINSLAILSTGEKLDNPRTLRRFEKKLRKLQQALSRKVKGSRNRLKAKLKVARLHARIRNIRHDYIHKFTSSLVSRFRFIGLEDLNVKGMVKNHCIAKSIQDASFGLIRRQIEYKSELAGTILAYADRFYPSSKTCSACGLVNKDLARGEEYWTCSCGVSHDRDINAAINLERVALRYRETLNACGETLSPYIYRGVEAVSVKQEPCSLTTLVTV